MAKIQIRRPSRQRGENHPNLFIPSVDFYAFVRTHSSVRRVEGTFRLLLPSGDVDRLSPTGVHPTPGDTVPWVLKFTMPADPLPEHIICLLMVEGWNGGAVV